MSSRVIPGLRYRDAHAAIAFLEKVFGFHRQAVYEAPNGTLEHAQLTLGTGMIMLGTVRGERGASPDEIAQPEDIGMMETQAPYIIVDDVKAVYASAIAAGGTTLREPIEMSYGGWGCSFRDPEGHVWHVGDYNPWTSQS